MTVALRAPVADCRHCGKEFVPSKVGHWYCSTECRLRGPRPPQAPAPPDPEQIERLFDPSRDPGELAGPGDWHPYLDLEDGDAWCALDGGDTIGVRRAWYLSMAERGGL
jgi:hypothetical protein